MNFPVCKYCQGDWLIPYGSDSPDRIRDVSYQEEPAGIWCTISFRNNRHTYTYPDCCKPIPLTAEILEKNGFVIKKKWAQRGNFGDNPLIMWHFDDDCILNNHKHELEIHDNSTGKLHISFICDYVHQLQHALRLCGIETEIVL